MGAEAGGDLVEIAVVMAGMTDELPDAIGEMIEKITEDGGVQATGSRDAYCAVWGMDSLPEGRELLMEATLEVAERAELQAPERRSVAPLTAPGRLEGIANGTDARSLGSLQQGAADEWEEVCVFVRVEMGDGDARAMELLNLGEGLPDEIFGTDTPEESGLREGQQRSTKAPAIRAEEGGDGVRGRDRRSVDESDVAADAQTGQGARPEDGVFQGGARRHEGRRGEGSGVEEGDDGAVDAGCQAEVVRVEDETRRHRVERR